jgi:hypothetical protein
MRFFCALRDETAHRLIRRVRLELGEYFRQLQSSAGVNDVAEALSVFVQERVDGAYRLQYNSLLGLHRCLLE